MNIKDLDRHEQARKKLWCDAWIATAGSSNCVDSAVATTYADNALRQFDDRFKRPILSVDE